MSTSTADLTKLREEIERLTTENANLRTKQEKFGLTYKTYPEEGDAQRILRGEIPFLNFNPEFSTLKESKTEADTPHVLIEGDNLPVLISLQATHRGKVDVIYIDPPYNTGKKDFIYNDSFVSDDDGFRHSKWLSFMKPRLVLAKELLSETGVVFVSIDDNEQAPLKLLMDEVFGGQNFIANMVWKSGSGVGQDSKLLSNPIEYILVYGKQKDRVSFNSKIVDINSYKMFDNHMSERGGYKLNSLDRGSLPYSKSLDYVIHDSKGKTYTAGSTSLEEREERISNSEPRKDWCWRWSKEKLQWGIENDYIVFKNGKVYFKQYALADNKGNSLQRSNPYSAFVDTTSTSAGTGMLKQILRGQAFSYPKSIDLVKHILKISSSSDSIVLDFFAGSGTTAHAVAELNKEDGGNRQCILVTHGEEKGKSISQAVTAERMKRVLTGKNWADGKEHEPLPGELYYYQLDYRETEDDVIGTDFVGYVSLVENAHTVVDQDVDENAVILDGKDHLVGVWTDYNTLDPYYEDELEDGTPMSEYRVRKMNEWAESEGRDIVWYVDTDPFFSDLVSHGDIFEEGTTCKNVSVLTESYSNRITNTRNLLKGLLAEVEEEDEETEDTTTE